MSDGNEERWNPEDGPEPTDEERAEARALADALAGTGGPKRGADADLDALLDAALRVTATAHPDAARVKAAASAAVAHAMEHASQRWYRRNWRWLALVAAAVLGVTGVQLAVLRPPADDTTPITHAATDVFDAPLDRDARSAPIDRIADARLRSYRDGILRGRHERRAP